VRRGRWLALPITALAAMVAAAEEEPPVLSVPGGGEPLIRGFRHEPRANLVYLDQRVELHPKAMVGARRNDNIDAVREARGATSLFAGVGLDGRWRPTTADRIDASVEALSERFPQDHRRDVDGGRVAAIAIHEALEWGASLGGGASRRLAQSETTGATLGLDQADATAAATVRGRISEASLALRVAGEEWRTPGPGYVEAERDLFTTGAEARATYRFGERSEARARLAGERRDYPDTGRFNDSISGIAAVGGSLATGTRSWFSGEAGLWARRHDDDFAGDPTYDDRQTLAPVGELAWTWDWESGSRFQTRASSQRYDGYRSNTTADHAVMASVMVRLGRDTDLTGRGELHRLVDSGAPADEAERTADETRLLGVLRHGFSRGIEARLRVDHVDRRSSADDDFERWIVTVALGVLL